MKLIFNQEGDKYVATYDGASGALQLICPSGTEVYVMGDAGAGVYHMLDGGMLRGEKFLRYLDMTGLTSVKIQSSSQPIQAIVSES